MPEQQSPVQSTESPEGPKLVGSHSSNVEEFITPAEIHWVDISKIDSFTIQNVVGTVLIASGMLAIALVSQVNSRDEGIKWAVEIPSIIVVLLGIILYLVSYTITLRQLKKKKRPL